MNNTAKQLADALRALFDSPREGQMGEGTKLLCGELNLDEARLALAAYDAQQAQRACTGSNCDETLTWGTHDKDCALADGHTGEPWWMAAHDAESFAAGAGNTELAVIKDRVNARRIVACVNACAGIPTAELEGAQFITADDETPLYELVRA